MRVLVTGATGNVGSHVLDALSADDAIESIVGFARRRPSATWPKTEFVAGDVRDAPLNHLCRDVDVVVHLAWLIQPSRDPGKLEEANVGGSRKVFEAARNAGVKSIVYASSVGAYSPSGAIAPVDESWPTEGIPSSIYSRQKAAVERLLDQFEADTPGVRVARMRPGLIFSRGAASGIRRLFAGPLLPSFLLRPGLLPILPVPTGLRIQAVHSSDVARAFQLAIHSDAAGAFNVAADPILDKEKLGQLLGARPVDVAPRVLRPIVRASWRLRIQPTPSGWLDLGLGSPVMDVTRANAELGWSATRGADTALLELVGGMRERSGRATPPLDPSTGGPLRLGEFASGVGARG